MRLHFNGSIFVLYAAGTPERDAARANGFHWDDDRREWWTSDLSVAARLRAFADDSAKEKLSRLLLDITPWTGRIPYPDHLEPKEYQLEAATHALSRNRTYLGLDPGLGKSIVSALILNALPEAYCVFICPPFLMLNIEYELKKWDTSGRSIVVHGRDRWDTTPSVQIIPDSLLSREVVRMKVRQIAAGVKARGRQLLMIVDEAHRYKTDTATRTKELLGHQKKMQPRVPGLFDHADRGVFLSGTPMPNRPMELYPILSNAAPETIDFMTRFQYGKYFCAGYRGEFGWDFNGASRMKELSERVIPKFMLRLKKSVLKLPPKLEEIVVIGEHLPPMVAAMEAPLLKAFSPEDLMGHLAPNDHIATYRKNLGTAKLSLAIPFIESILDETEESVLVFAIHKDTIKGLTAGLKKYNPLVIDGSVPAQTRQGIANEFETSDARRVVILNIQAGGVGFNLTKATRVVFVEFSWVPAENEQASDRAHRYGQAETVLVQYLVYKNSIDRSVMETCFRKKRITNHV